MQLLWVAMGLPVALLAPLSPSHLPHRTLRGDGCRTVSLCDCALPVWGRGQGNMQRVGLCAKAVPSAGCRGAGSETSGWGDVRELCPMSRQECRLWGESRLSACSD